MCGIIGIIGNRNVSTLLIESLHRLEYRGYDSAGIATVHNGELARLRVQGKIVKLEKLLDSHHISGKVGIGHTRWATHGVPNENNAHPHMTNKVAVVHNGIIENYRALATDIGLKPGDMESETDTEVLVHLLTFLLNEGKSPLEAVQAMLPRLKGAFSLCILFADYADLMIGARQGSPLAIGFGEGEMYFGSDAISLAPFTQDICYLQEGDYAVASSDTVKIFDKNTCPAKRPVVKTSLTGASIGKGNFRHFMLKEIFEQPTVIGDTLATMVHPARQTLTLPIDIDVENINRITISGCGTAYYAGLVAKYWAEQLLKIPVEADVASELRYRRPPMVDGGLAIFISQSGETMDTVQALKYCKENNQLIVSVVNTLESTIAREADVVLQTLAGPEIGVASTKAFTTQLTVLLCGILAMAKMRNTVSLQQEKHYIEALLEIPGLVAKILNEAENIKRVSHIVSEAQDVLFLGRGIQYPIAMEGALKLKELSYIHAEGYAAGEMKHGPIALIDEHVPIIVNCPSDSLFDKTAGNIQEVLTRGGKVICISDCDGIRHMKNLTSVAFEAIEVPKVDSLVAPILYTIPVQLLAYYCAMNRGTDIDQPRNLAKSVTVE